MPIAASASLDRIGPNGLHAEPCLAAARADRQLSCEKRSGVVDLSEARQVLGLEAQ